MDGFKEEAVDISGIPVYYALAESGAGLKHGLKLRDSKFQHMNWREGGCGQGKLDAEIGGVVTGEYGSRTVKADDSAPSCLVFGKVNRVS